MPKFFVVSDVHSFYTPLIEALNAAGFDKNNEDHWLISCGDLFDRGDESKEVLDFVQSLPRKILIKGNHEYLLEDMLRRKSIYDRDVHNGTVKTVKNLNGFNLSDDAYIYFAYFSDMNDFPKHCTKVKKITKDYFKNLVPYFETENHVFVHSMLPSDNEVSPVDNWRTAKPKQWEQATWENPFKFFHGKDAIDGKTVVFGHWHTSWARHEFENKMEFGDGADFSPYYGNHYIGIDACTAYSKKVNVLVIEDDFINQ